MKFTAIVRWRFRPIAVAGVCALSVSIGALAQGANHAKSYFLKLVCESADKIVTVKSKEDEQERKLYLWTLPLKKEETPK